MKACRPLFVCVRLAALACAVLLFLPCFGSCAPVAGDLAEPEKNQVEEYTGKIIFEGRRYSYEGEPENISVENDALIIKKEGVYLLSGKLSEGRIITDAPWTHLVFDGVEMYSTVSSVIESRRGALIIESRENSLNILRSDCAKKEKTQGALAASGDVFLLGEGKIVAAAPRLNYALTCRRLYAESGELSLTSEGGIFTSEARISGGKITVSGAKIGIHAYGGEDSTGLIEMTGGSFVAVCEDTALLADETLLLTGGERDIRAPKPCVCKKDEQKEIESNKRTVYE